MNAPWIIGISAAVIFFTVFEARALAHPERYNTLSRAIYNLGSRWPLSIWIMGVFCGVLAAHFFWHWCPDGAVSIGLYLEALPRVCDGHFPRYDRECLP